MNYYNLIYILTALVTALSGVSPDFVYSETKICSSHKSKFCLAINRDTDFLTLNKHKRQQLTFNVEAIPGSKDELRLFTTDEDTEGKLCLVKKPLDEDIDGLSLEDCGTSEDELFLSLSEFDADEDTFKLQLHDSDEDLCLTNTYSTDQKVHVTKNRVHLHTNSPVILSPCSEVSSFGQDFSAVSYLSRSVTPAPTTEPRFGYYCVKDKPELCLGVSLTNGTELEDDKYIQVKNLTKNAAKDLETYKLLWYKNYVTETDLNLIKLANGAEPTLCMEAMYDVYVGDNRKGTPVIDDILHLGICDDVANARAKSLAKSVEEQNAVSSERFTLVAKDGYSEIQTTEPNTENVWCATVVQCSKHDNDNCVPYSTKVVENVAQLEQGAHVRLKKCDSVNNPGQRFFYKPDFVTTEPPVFHPTQQPIAISTASPSAFPTAKTLSPTGFPTVKVVEPSPTSSPTLTEGGKGGEGAEDTTGSNGPENWLKGVLSLVGILAFAIIIIGLAYYARSKRRDSTNSSAGAGAEESENFVARV